MDLWAKTMLEGDTRKFYRLTGHLLDTAIVASVLLERYFEPNTVESFGRLWPARPELAFPLLAGLHDCGKASPVFQSRLTDRPRPRWAPDPVLPAPKFDGTWGLVDESSKRQFRHEQETGRLIRRIGGDPLLAAVLEAHHGRFFDVDTPLSRGVAAYIKEVEQGPWGDEQVSIVDEVVSVVAGSDSGDLTSIGSTFELAAFAPSFAGWVSVADWIASDEESVRHGVKCQELLDTDPVKFYGQRRQFLEDLVPALIGHYSAPEGPFKALFGFEPDRPVQRHIVSTEPALFSLIAAPMGEGKTEAALERHRRLGSRSLYVAMPTMATADAMFGRVRAMFGHSSETTGAALLHGRAGVHDFYAGVDDDTDFDHVGGDSTGLEAQAWLRGRHRGLLAPVGVGTVDQVLAAILRAKYNTIRLAAIANSHIIFDEVHTYDAYQQSLLELVLQWMGMHRAPVTLLSATTPSVLAARLVDAYDQGLHVDPDRQKRSSLTLSYPGVLQLDDGSEPPSLVGLSVIDRRTIDVSYRCWNGSPADDVVVAVREWRDRFPMAAIGVVVNTVDTSISVAVALADLNPLVLHSRMPVAMRSKREGEVLGAVGKGSTSGGRLIVGTQILEHSLDIDFDVLVTEFAPTADLIQRTGRLWRHSSCRNGVWNHPPTRRWRLGLDAPQMIVLAASEFTKQTCLPYPQPVIRWSWDRGFRAGTLEQFVVPDDLQDMVDRSHVTFDSDSFDDEAVQELFGKEASKRSLAGDRAIPLAKLWDYRGEEHLYKVTLGAGGPEERKTRWNDLESATVVLLGTESEWALRVEDLRGDRREVSKAIINASINLSGSTLKKLKDDLKTLDTFVSPLPSPYLADTCCLDLDECQTYRLDPELGLVSIIMTHDLGDNPE